MCIRDSLTTALETADPVLLFGFGASTALRTAAALQEAGGAEGAPEVEAICRDISEERSWTPLARSHETSSPFADTVSVVPPLIVPASPIAPLAASHGGSRHRGDGAATRHHHNTGAAPRPRGPCPTLLLYWAPARP